jgi:hypothetical protein
LVSFLPATSLQAELTELTGKVEARTDQRVTGQETSFETAFEVFPETTTQLPAQAETGLIHIDGSGAVVGQGRALAIFSEPEVEDFTNPEDIGVSAVAFSTADGVSYLVTGAVTETRAFIFGADEAGEDAGTEIEVDSELFLNGGLVIWGEPGVTDLSGAIIDGSIHIVQIRADQPDTTLVTLSVTLAGQSDGTVTATLSAEINGLPIDAAAVVEPPSGPLDGAIGGQVDLPSLVLPFTYSAIVGDADDSNVPFELEAVVEITCDNGPGGGIGAAAVLGAPLFGPTDTAGTLARAVTETITTVAPARAQIVPSVNTTGILSVFSLCGVLGIESALLLLICGAACIVRPFSLRS